jgi:hypothetical protein
MADALIDAALRESQQVPDKQGNAIVVAKARRSNTKMA